MEGPGGREEWGGAGGERGGPPFSLFHRAVGHPPRCCWPSAALLLAIRRVAVGHPPRCCWPSAALLSSCSLPPGYRPVRRACPGGSAVGRQVREERMAALLKKQKLEEEKMRTNDERFPALPPPRSPVESRAAARAARRVAHHVGEMG